MNESLLQIGELASLASVTIDTVRYYERRGLLPRAARSRAGYRLFSTDSVARIEFIKQGQELGFSLDEITELLATGGAEECRRVSDLLEAKLIEVDQKIKNMRAFRKTLAEHFSKCKVELESHGTNASCPVLVEITPAGTAGDERRSKRSRK
jgi:DNA-binding transcriptional MerR regulator